MLIGVVEEFCVGIQLHGMVLLEDQPWTQSVKVLASGYDFQTSLYQFTFLIRVAHV